MPNRHEPDNEFVERLREQIEMEMRRRSRFHEIRTGRRTLAVLGLMLASMGVGAAGVAAAYQAADDARLALVISGLELQAELASERLALATQDMAVIQRDVDLGAKSVREAIEAQIRVAAAEAAVRSLELDLEEVRITGREPLDDLSAPLAGGRDFVSERLRIDMSAGEAGLAFEEQRLAEAERRLELGILDVTEVDLARARTAELEAAVEAIRSKIEVRGQVLSGGIGEIEAGLRALEIEAEQRLRSIEPRIRIANNELERAEQALQLGTVDEIAVSQARLRRLQAESDLVEAEIELARVRRQLAARR